MRGDGCFVRAPNSLNRFSVQRRPRRSVCALYISSDGLDVDFTRPSRTGNFGNVYFGRYANHELDVVVKCAQDSELARALYKMEAHCNARLAGSYSEESRYPQYYGQIKVPTSARVGMVWAREATETLEDYLRPANINALACVLGVQDSGVPRRRLAAALLYELLMCISQLWDFDLVHRDLKPGNLLVVPGASSRLKVIDLGSACEWGMLNKRNLRNATCDPVYVPPERRLRVMQPADRFDVYSVGLIVLRAALPSLTDERRMASFVDQVLIPSRHSLPLAKDKILSGSTSATVDLRQDFAALDSELNGDLYSVLCTLLAPRPEDRNTAKSALCCSFLRNEGIPLEE